MNLYYRFFTKSRPDRYWCTYARWDGKFNNPETRLCWILFRLGRPSKKLFLITLHPIWQYPFGMCGNFNPFRYNLNVRVFWIQVSLVWNRKF